jgi:carboxypeptidase T
MKRTLYFVLFSFGVASTVPSASRPELYTLRLPLKRPLIEDLARRGFDVSGVDLESQEFEVITDSAGRNQIESLTGVRPVSYRTIETLDASYKQLSEVERLLSAAENNYPRLVTVETIGQSTEGRPILAARLTDASRTPEDGKTVVLIDAMHHAREVMTPEIALDIVDYLTTRFEQDAQVRRWLTENEIWVVPMLNPDGNNRVWSTNTQWRKNTRGGFGVDNNRNYPYAWGTCNGSSGSTSSEQYRGPSPGSEPETKALMKLAQRIRPTINISYHTASEIVIYPLSCPNQILPPEEKSIVEKIGRELGAKLTRDSGSGTYQAGTSYDLLYPVDGGSSDWMYEEVRALAYTIEANSLNQGFQPSFTRWRNSTVERNRAGWQFILNRIQSSAVRVQALPGEKIRIQTPSGRPVFDKEADRWGWAHFVVNPGDYRVLNDSRSSAPQTASVGQGVSVVKFPQF